MSEFRLPIVACCFIVAAALAAPQARAAQDANIEAGHEFLLDNCSRCHAVEAKGASPFAEAPPFRDLHESYSVETLAESLAEGIVTGHPDMPQFILSPEEIDAVIAYLHTLE